MMKYERENRFGEGFIYVVLWFNFYIDIGRVKKFI